MSRNFKIFQVPNDIRGSVLFVDDMKTNLGDYEKYTQIYLPKVSFELQQSQLGTLEFLEENEIHVLVTDMYMEDDEAGLVLLQHIIKKIPHIIVIVATAYEERADLERECLKLGCYEYLKKSDEGFNEKLFLAITEGIVLAKSKRDWHDKDEKTILTSWRKLQREQILKVNPIRLQKTLIHLCENLFSSIFGWGKIRGIKPGKSLGTNLVIINEQPNDFWHKWGGEIILLACDSTEDPLNQRNFQQVFSDINIRKTNGCKLAYYIHLSNQVQHFPTKSNLQDGMIILIDKMMLWKLIVAKRRKKYLENLMDSHISGSNR